VAVAFDAGRAANPTGFAAALRGLDQLDADGVTASLDRLSGESHSGLATTALQTATAFVGQFSQQAALARLGASGASSGQSAMAAGGRQELASLSGGSDDGATNDVSASVADIDKPWGVWASGYGQVGQLDGDGNSHRLDETIGGGSVGADYKLTPALRVGAGLGYGGTTFSLDDGGGRAEVDHTQFALYADYTMGPAYLDGTVGFAYGDGTTRRNVSLPGALAQAAGHVTDTQVLGSVEAGYGLGLGATTVTPFAGLSLASADQNAFTETGAGVLDLHVAKQSQSSVRSMLGSRLTADMALGSQTITTDASVGWAHEFAPTDRGTDAAFVGAPSAGFQVAGVKVPGNSALIGVGIATTVFADTSVYLHYDGSLAAGANTNAVTAGFRWSW
jgi:outer membrane autotransporter protein